MLLTFAFSKRKEQLTGNSFHLSGDSTLAERPNSSTMVFPWLYYIVKKIHYSLSVLLSITAQAKQTDNRKGGINV